MHVVSHPFQPLQGHIVVKGDNPLPQTGHIHPIILGELVFSVGGLVVSVDISDSTYFSV